MSSVLQESMVPKYERRRNRLHKPWNAHCSGCYLQELSNKVRQMSNKFTLKAEARQILGSKPSITATGAKWLLHCTVQWISFIIVMIVTLF